MAPTVRDTLLQRLRAALAFEDRRLRVARTNLANAATPGYKARVVERRGPVGGLALATTDPRHIGARPVVVERVRRGVAVGDRLDGNTVQPDLEEATLVDAVLAFKADAELVRAHLQRYEVALTETKR